MGRGGLRFSLSLIVSELSVWFPVPVTLAVKSNLTAWCYQNLSKRALNALVVQASITELGRLFEVLTTHAEKIFS